MKSPSLWRSRRAANARAELPSIRDSLSQHPRSRSRAAARDRWTAPCSRRSSTRRRLSAPSLHASRRAPQTTLRRRARASPKPNERSSLPVHATERVDRHSHDRSEIGAAAENECADDQCNQRGPSRAMRRTPAIVRLNFFHRVLHTKVPAQRAGEWTHCDFRIVPRLHARRLRLQSKRNACPRRRSGPDFRRCRDVAAVCATRR